MVTVKTTHLNFFGQLQAFKKFKDAYPRYVGNMAVNFYKDSFKRGGYIDTGGLQKWEPRKKLAARGSKPKGNRALLVKTGNLRRSIKIIRSGLGFVVVGTNLPYARIHNEGGTITSTQNIGAYTRKAHKRKAYTRTWQGNSQSIKATQIAQSQIKAHSRKQNTKMTQRQFMGLSQFLMRRILLNTEYKIKQILNTK